MHEIKRILVATDFSSHGNFAIHRAISLAGTFKSTVTALHVITENLQEVPLFFLDEDKIEELKHHLQRRARETLKTTIASIPNPDNIQIETKIREGIAYRQIVLEAGEGQYDLLVIGAKGKNKFKEFFNGSNAEKVVRRSPCSVYLVKKDLSEGS